jgi:hypothetical protein
MVPSEFVETIGITVTLVGATPPVAACIASYAAEAASLCSAAVTPGSFAFAGRANDSVSVSGTLTVSVKLMTMAAASRRVAKCVTKVLRDGDAAENSEEGDKAGAEETLAAKDTVSVPHIVAPPDDETAP